MSSTVGQVGREATCGPIGNRPARRLTIAAQDIILPHAGVPGLSRTLLRQQSIACTLITAWAAARIFRVGSLMQGKAPDLHEMLRWAVRG